MHWARWILFSLKVFRKDYLKKILSLEKLPEKNRNNMVQQMPKHKFVKLPKLTKRPASSYVCVQRKMPDTGYPIILSFLCSFVFPICLTHECAFRSLKFSHSNLPLCGRRTCKSQISLVRFAESVFAIRCIPTCYKQALTTSA